MFGQTFYNRELIQWSYLALILVALAFTTLAVAAESTNQGEYFKLSATDELGACLLPPERRSSHRRPVCDSGTENSSLESFQAAIRSAFKLESPRLLQSTSPSLNGPRRYTE